MGWGQVEGLRTEVEQEGGGRWRLLGEGGVLAQGPGLYKVDLEGFKLRTGPGMPVEQE